MDSLIETFHIDWRIFIAQIINFTIVFSVLYWFAFKPLMKILTERSKKIEDSLKNAAKIEKELKSTEAGREQIIRQARQEASALLAEIEHKGEERKKEMMIKTKEEIEKIVAKTKADLEIEKEIMLKHVKEEAAEMIVSAVEKILGEKIDSGVDKNYVEKVVKNI